MRPGNRSVSKASHNQKIQRTAKHSARKNRTRKATAFAGLCFESRRLELATSLIIVTLIALATPANADYPDRSANFVAGTVYERPAASYQIRFPDSLDASVSLITGDRHVEFTLEEMSYNAGEDYLGSLRPATAVIDDDIVAYPEAFEDVDVEYQITPAGIKEFFVLNQRPRAPASHLLDPTLDFSQRIEAGGLTMVVDGITINADFTTEQSIAFVDAVSGETVFSLPAPYAVDAAGDVVPIRYFVQTQGNEFRIHTQTPHAWLADPARAYPVKIDPSVTLNAEYAVSLEGGNTWDTGWIGTGEFSGTQRSGIDFDTSVIPDGAVIEKVELKLYIDDEGTPLNNDVGNMSQKAYAYHVTDDDMPGFDADTDGNEYLSNSGGFAGEGSYHTVELLAAAATDLQNQLSADWFSVGWTGTTEASNNYRDAHS